MPFTIFEMISPFSVLHHRGIYIAAWSDGVDTPYNDACEKASDVYRIAETLGDENLTQESYVKEATRRRDEAILTGDLEVFPR